MFLLPATLLKVTLSIGVFLRFLNCTNGSKSHKASHLLVMFQWLVIVSIRVKYDLVFFYSHDMGENFNFLKYYNFFSLPPTILYQMTSLILKKLSKLKKVRKIKIRQLMKQLQPRQLLLVLQLPKALQKRWWRKAVEQIPHHFFVDMLLKESVFLKENW